MKERALIILKHPLIAGSSVVFIGSFVASIFSYLFNLAMGRMLSVENYGLLTALTSLLVVLTILDMAFTRIFAKFSARYIVKGENGKLRHLIASGTKYILLISAVYLFFLIIAVDLLGNFLHIDNKALLIVIFVSVCISLLGSIPSGILQGSLRFYMNSFLSIIQSFSKLVIAVLFVFLGMQVFGAVLSILLSASITIIIGYIVILKYLKNKDKIEVIPNFRNEFTHYTYTFVLTSIGITLLANTDILLVRHFFEETVSGQYAALSLMGKAIFYLILPINFVFFPLIAQKKERNERLFNTVVFTSSIVFISSIAISFVYFTFPGFILGIFFPAPEYQTLKPLLGIFSLYVLVFSLVNIMNSFFLSVGKTKVYIFTLLAAFFQITLIAIFHNSLYQVIGVLFFVNFLLLLTYFIYYMKHGKD